MFLSFIFPLNPLVKTRKRFPLFGFPRPPKKKNPTKKTPPWEKNKRGFWGGNSPPFVLWRPREAPPLQPPRPLEFLGGGPHKCSEKKKLGKKKKMRLFEGGKLTRKNFVKAVFPWWELFFPHN